MNRIIKSQITNDTLTIDTRDPLVLASEQANDYSDSLKYAEALYEESQNQYKLNKYVSECLILSENVSVYSKFHKLKALHEADVNIGEKSSSNMGWFDKVIAFIKKIWGKFVEKITRWMTTNNYYLEKYKDIILKKEPKIGDITFDDTPCNFTEAVNRISQDSVIQLANLTTINGLEELPLPGENDNEKKTKQKELAIKICKNLGDKYDTGSNDSFGTWCKEYFEGKVPAAGIPQTIKPSELNFTMMYNFCHNAGAIRDILNKDKDNVDKAASEILNTIKQFLETYKKADSTNKDTLVNAQRGAMQAQAATNIDFSQKECDEFGLTNEYNTFKKAEDELRNIDPKSNGEAYAKKEQEVNKLKTDLITKVKQKKIEGARKNVDDARANIAKQTSTSNGTVSAGSVTPGTVKQ